MVVMPQFPLGTVLFPSMVLPLHVFELRYRKLVEDVLAGDGTFGVALIERGFEVGGGDQRTMFGTTAKVVNADELADGRWSLITVGAERFRVNEWLSDDPYPLADVDLWPDETTEHDLSEVYQRVSTKFRRCMALAAESGLNVGPQHETTDDVELGCMHMSAMVPVTSHDKQSLLGASGPEQRLDLLDEMIDSAVELIEARLTDFS